MICNDTTTDVDYQLHCSYSMSERDEVEISIWGPSESCLQSAHFYTYFNGALGDPEARDLFISLIGTIYTDQGDYTIAENQINDTFESDREQFDDELMIGKTKLIVGGDPGSRHVRATVNVDKY